jgi:hypothetical protein
MITGPAAKGWGQEPVSMFEPFLCYAAQCLVIRLRFANLEDGLPLGDFQHIPHLLGGIHQLEVDAPACRCRGPQDEQFLVQLVNAISSFFIFPPFGRCQPTESLHF